MSLGFRFYFDTSHKDWLFKFIVTIIEELSINESNAWQNKAKWKCLFQQAAYWISVYLYKLMAYKCLWRNQKKGRGCQKMEVYIDCNVHLHCPCFYSALYTELHCNLLSNIITISMWPHEWDFCLCFIIISIMDYFKWRRACFLSKSMFSHHLYLYKKYCVCLQMC